MIPTYDTDTLGYWVADNEEALAANHIDLSPSASRCTINLQDHETSCSAYRLEFQVLGGCTATMVQFHNADNLKT